MVVDTVGVAVAVDLVVLRSGVRYLFHADSVQSLPLRVTSIAIAHTAEISLLAYLDPEMVLEGGPSVLVEERDGRLDVCFVCFIVLAIEDRLCGDGSAGFWRLWRLWRLFGHHWLIGEN